RTAVPPPKPGNSTKPPVPLAPQPAKVVAPKPAGRRPVSPPPLKTPPPPRSRRKVLATVAAVVCGVLVLGGTWMYVFKLTPVVAEKLLVVALFSKVPPVQRMAIKTLQGYPTKQAATALVVFINLKNLKEMEDPKKPWTPEEKERRRQQRNRDLKLAERATETLCLLTGQSFGTYFKLEKYGHSWGSLPEDKWPTVLWQIDTWAVQTFAKGDLPMLPGFFGATPQSARVPGEGQAR
ncbi:MAG TPA: hypothetical protein VLG48_02335, partial [Candidatus Methylomirabilis sp.]|nr:hypothetical protein [Candidatus Methylomirabilis sp.]